MPRSTGWPTSSTARSSSTRRKASIITRKNRFAIHSFPEFAARRKVDMSLISRLLPVANITLDLDVTSKKRVFEHVGLLFENALGIGRGHVFDALFARERLGSTGLGHGIAIPHGRIKGLR